MFIQRLKELRAKENISQAALAKKLGVSQQAVAKWETEKATPDPYMISKMATLFNVTTDYLLGNSNYHQIKTINDSPAQYSTKKTLQEILPPELAKEFDGYFKYFEVIKDKQITPEELDEVVELLRKLKK